MPVEWNRIENRDESRGRCIGRYRPDRSFAVLLGKRAVITVDDLRTEADAGHWTRQLRSIDPDDEGPDSGHGRRRR